MPTAIRSAAFVVALALSSSCRESRALPAAPSPPTDMTAAASPAPAPAPAPTMNSAAAGHYENAQHLEHPISSYTKTSQFLLNRDGTFVLRYPGLGEYGGTYTEVNGHIVFWWNGWSAAGPWGATGAFDGSTLTVRYNLVMQLTDFEDALYFRVR